MSTAKGASLIGVNKRFIAEILSYFWPDALGYYQVIILDNKCGLVCIREASRVVHSILPFR